MAEDNRLVEIMSEMLVKQDKMIDQQIETNKRLGHLEGEVVKLNDHVVKLNLQTAENTRAILKLADKVEKIADLDKRVKELEKAVFK